MASNSSASASYVHKSGALKRRLKLQKLLKEEAADSKQKKILNFFTHDMLTLVHDAEPEQSPINVACDLQDAELEQSPINVACDLQDVELEQSPINVACDLQDVEPEQSPINVACDLQDAEPEQSIASKLISKKIQELSAFIPPKNSAENIIQSFVSQHPIQPIVGTDKRKLTFDASRVYNRMLPNGEVIPRSWISYQSDCNKLFCFMCMAYSSDRRCPFVVGYIVNVKHIYDAIKKHEISSTHQVSAEAYLLGNKHKTVLHLLSNERCKEIQFRRQVMLRLIDIILFIGRQGLAFRGTCESLKFLSNPSLNKGNFLELVLLISKYDAILKQHVDLQLSKIGRGNSENLSTAAKKGRGSLITLLSKTTVNRLVIIIGEYIQQQISCEVRKSGSFSLEVDTTQDTAVLDQLAVVVRYVLEDKVKERLLSIMSSRQGTGEGLYKSVKSEFTRLQIPLSRMVSCAFDGASNMQGIYKGLQSFLKIDAPKSVNTHCHAHNFALVMSDATESVIFSQSFFGLLGTTAVFISESYKRMQVWSDLMEGVSETRSKLRKLQKIGKTRWTSKNVALSSVFHDFTCKDTERERYIILLQVLDFVSGSGQFDSKVAYQAHSLLENFIKFDTLVTAFLFMEIFHFCTPVTKYLQTRGVDFLTSIGFIKKVKSQLEQLRTSGFTNVYQKTKNFANFVQDQIDLKHADFTCALEIEKDFSEKRKI